MSDERTTFEFLRGNGEEGTRLFLKVFSQKTHYMIELDENELTELRDVLNSQPTNFNGDNYGQ